MASNVGTRYAAIARCFDDADCPEARKDDPIVVCGSDLYVPLKYLAAGTAAGQVGSGQYLPLDDARFMSGPLERQCLRGQAHGRAGFASTQRPAKAIPGRIALAVFAVAGWFVGSV